MSVLQVVPTRVAHIENPEEGSKGTNAEASSIQVVRRGNIASWDGLEALLYYALFRQVLATAPEHGRPNLYDMHAICSLASPHFLLIIFCVALQLGWEEAEEGLLIVSEPLFFPRVSSGTA